MSLDNKYPVEIIERCLRWTQQDEGKIFWRWLKQEIERVTPDRSLIGAWEQKDIIRANQMKSRAEEAEYIAAFQERLKMLVHEIKQQGDEFGDITDI